MRYHNLTTNFDVLRAQHKGLTFSAYNDAFLRRAEKALKDLEDEGQLAVAGGSEVTNTVKQALRGEWMEAFWHASARPYYKISPEALSAANAQVNLDDVPATEWHHFAGLAVMLMRFPREAAATPFSGLETALCWRTPERVVVNVGMNHQWFFSDIPTDGTFQTVSSRVATFGIPEEYREAYAGVLRAYHLVNKIEHSPVEYANFVEFDVYPRTKRPWVLLTPAEMAAAGVETTKLHGQHGWIIGPREPQD